MNHSAKRRALRFRVQAQWTLLLLLFTLVTTFATGWIIYGRVSEQVVRDAWRQHESLLDSACMALDQQIGQIRSFSWQMNNSVGVERYLYLKEQTPRDILTKKEIIESLQEMKAFSTTLSDIGFYAEGTGLVVTAESSYPAGDFYSRVDGVSLEDMLSIRRRTDSIALCAFAGRASISRIISAEDVLVFISSLPMNSAQGSSYAFFHLSADRLGACLPESESGVLLLCDGTGAPLLQGAGEAFAAVSRQYMEGGASKRVRVDGADYGVLCRPTASKGLYCMAVVPYDELLLPVVKLRRAVMLVIGVCMAIGLVGAVYAGKRLYTPLERLMKSVKQLGHGLPEGGRANEYKILDEAIHMISAENHALTLSNREIHRLLKNRLLSDWMEGRLKDAEALAKAGVSLPYDRAQIAVAEMNPRGLEQMEKDGGAYAADRVEALAAAQDLGPMAVFCAQRTDGRLLVLFNLDARHPLPESIYTFLRQCRQELFGGMPCAIGVGRAYGVRHAPDSLVDAMLALSGGSGMDDSSLRLAEEIPDVPDTEYTLAAEQQLINQMLGGRREEAEATLRALCAPEEGSGVPRAGLVRALLFTARRVAWQAGAEDSYARILEEAGFSADEMPMGHDAADRLCRVVFAVMDCVNADVSTREEKQFLRLTEYIKSRFREDISLDSAGEALSMSPSYIGLVFRRVGGTSFLKYLTDIRVAEAKRLLVTTDLPLREIGARVGIENQNTLIRTFKKAEGVTPGQYRMANSSIRSQNG